MGNDNQRLVAAAACCIWLLTVVALVSGQAEPPHVTELRRAAEQSHADAQANLGNLYADGRGVPQDYGRLSAGGASLPTRATPTRRPTSAPRTPSAAVYRRTTG